MELYVHYLSQNNYEYIFIHFSNFSQNRKDEKNEMFIRDSCLLSFLFCRSVIV